MDPIIFPSLLEPRRRSERALLGIIQQAYVEGVSTRRVDDLVKALGCEGISKSQVSRICAELDEVVDSFLGRPLDGGPYRYVWLDGAPRDAAQDTRLSREKFGGDFWADRPTLKRKRRGKRACR